MRTRLVRCAVAAALAGIVGTGAVAAPAISVSAKSSSHAPLPTAPKGYRVSVFARATTAFSNPDSLVATGSRVYVGYQNVTAKDGTDGRSSTVVEYTLSGRLRRTFSVPGHVDGLRQDPSTGLLWALSNEDANPRLTIIDPSTGSTTGYTFATPPHGGGYDDLAFLGGKVYLTASNPPDPNTFPALVSATLSGTTVVVIPVLMGNATATDLVTHTSVTLNLIDPDSLYVTPSGDLQLDNQAGGELIFIHNPGPGQTVTRLGIGNAMDDTILPTSASGRLLVSDTGGGAVYSISSKHFDTTLYYSAAPQDSGVSGYVGLVNPTTGANTPLITGMRGPHGEAFLPASNN
ncbi:MAG TPA: hypothetical protein VGL20_21160 [Candidatus Dormibacteraeota bacterium]